MPALPVVGVDQETASAPSPGVTMTAAGASIALIATGPLGWLASEWPAVPLANTKNTYVVPLARPITLHEVVLASCVSQVSSPGSDTTVYRETPAPALAGAVHETLAPLAVYGTAVTPTGALGAPVPD